MQFKGYLLTIIGIFCFTFTCPNNAIAAYVGYCAGNNYEQQMPVSGVTGPSVSIEGVSVVNEGETIRLTANADVDIDKGGSLFFYWCAEKGIIEADNPDYSTVIYVAPFLPGSDETANITVRVGDMLGYVEEHTIKIDILEIGNENPNDPEPIISIVTPEELESNKPFMIHFEITDHDEYGNDMTGQLVTDLYYSINGGPFKEIVKGIRGSLDRYAWVPRLSSDEYLLKIVTTDGNSIVSKETDSFAVTGDEDGDGDGLSDVWEVTYFDDLSQDGTDDFDGDELSDSEEYNNGTDPTKPDTDNDGISDAWETDYGFDPLDDSDASHDPDNDGYTNLQEYNGGSDPTDPESYPIAGIFIVRNDIITIDWLYDGGIYQGELGIFSLRDMDLTVPDLTAFIKEAVARVLSGSEDGYIVLSDKTERAREFGTLSGEPTDWNEGEYNHAKSFPMRAGDRFALMLVPNGTFNALSRNPGTESTGLRPLFSFVSPNADYGMHTGQIADVNGMGLGFVFEDMEFTNSDRDYNDLIIQISGASSDIPTIDAMIELTGKAGRSRQARKDWYDWRVSDELGRKIIRHLEALPREDDYWVSVSFDGFSELRIYDAEERYSGTHVADIPGSLRFIGNGETEVFLPAVTGGSDDYRIILHSAEDETGILSIRGHLGTTELASDTIPVETGTDPVLRSALSAFPDRDLVTEFTEPDIPRAPDGTPLPFDFNGDGKMDDRDIEEITSAWNACEGDPGWNPVMDIDGDGCVTILDIMTVINSG